MRRDWPRASFCNGNVAHSSGIDPAKRYPHLRHGGYFHERQPYENTRRLNVQREWMKQRAKQK